MGKKWEQDDKQGKQERYQSPRNRKKKKEDKELSEVVSMGTDLLTELCHCKTFQSEKKKDS